MSMVLELTRNQIEKHAYKRPSESESLASRAPYHRKSYPKTRASERKNEQTNGRTNVQMEERTSELAIEATNE